MNHSIPTEVLEDIEFIKRAKKLDFKCSSEIDKHIKQNREIIETITDEDSEVLLFVKHEFIASKKILDNLISDIESKGVSYKIMSATSSYFKNYIHPIAGLISWNGSEIDVDVDWKHDGSDLKTEMFSYSRYKPYQSVNENREFKAIMSIRKSNLNRDLFFSSYSPQMKNGIVRYGKLPHHTWMTNSDSIRVKDFPKWNVLQREYENSYFSFIMETLDNLSYDNDETLDTSFTEKTLLGIMTGTMPIVLGYKGFVKSLENIGIKVWNNEFGFDNADERDDYSDIGLEYFNKCIENVNKMSMKDVELFWKENQEIIQNNYNIVSSIISDTKYRYDYIMNYKTDSKPKIKSII